jgi:hypothetical protein
MGLHSDLDHGDERRSHPPVRLRLVIPAAACGHRPGERVLLSRRGISRLGGEPDLPRRAALSAFFLEDLIAPIEGVE